MPQPRYRGPVPPISAPRGDRTETASYVSAMLGDLTVMARRGHLETLAYLLDMARLEAESSAHGKNGG